MSMSRRGIFTGIAQAAVISVAAAAVPAVVKKPRNKVSQDELTDSIVSHAAWIENSERGTRANFCDRDLSGLDFRGGSSDLVNLRGADFTGTDMTGVTGGNVSFLRASLHDARLSWSRFEQVCFSHASLRRSKCDNVEWGWDAQSRRIPSRLGPYDLSGFQHTDAGHGDFFRAKIRGFFHEARFVAAQLREADFSYSDFCGTGFSSTTFHAADLSLVKFNFASLSRVDFSSAKCTGTDFSGADVGYGARFSTV